MFHPKLNRRCERRKGVAHDRGEVWDVRRSLCKFLCTSCLCKFSSQVLPLSCSARVLCASFCSQADLCNFLFDTLSVQCSRYSGKLLYANSLCTCIAQDSLCKLICASFSVQVLCATFSVQVTLASCSVQVHYASALRKSLRAS